MANDYYSKDKVRRSLGHFVVGKAGGAIVGLLTLLLTVRVLSVPDYGLYVALVGYLEIFNVLSSVGLGALSERLVPEVRNSGDEARLRKLIGRLVQLRAVTVVVCCCIAAAVIQLAGARLGLGDTVAAALVFQLVVGCETLARYCETIFDSLLLQGRAQVSLLSRTALRMACIVGVWLTAGHIDLVQWLWFEAAAYAVGLLVTLGLTRRTMQALPADPRARAGIRPALRSSLQIYLSQALGVLVGIDVVKILVWRTTSADAAAVFGFCASLAWMVQRYLPSYLLVGMVRPLVVAAVAAGQRGADRLRAIVSIMLKINLLLVGCLVVVVATAGDTIVRLLSGGKFTAAGPLVLVLLVYVWSNSVRAILSYVAMAHGRGATMIAAQLAGGVVLVVGSFCLVHQLGAMAYGVALVLMNAAWSLLVIWQMRSAGQWPALPATGILRSACTVTACSAVGMLVNQQLGAMGFAWSVLGALSILALYLAGSAVIRAFDQDERQMINNMLPRPLFIF